MSFNNNIDIVKFLRIVVTNLKPYASNNGITLSFQTKIGHTSIKDYNPGSIQKEISNFLKQLIKFTPRNNKITVLFDDHFNNKDYCLLTVTNTGVNLFRVTEIIISTKFNTTPKGINANTSEFAIKVPIQLNETSNENEVTTKLNLSPYYLEIGKRL